MRRNLVGPICILLAAVTADAFQQECHAATPIEWVSFCYGDEFSCEDLVEELVGSAASVSQIQCDIPAGCDIAAAGIINNAQGNFGIGRAIVLTSGGVANVGFEGGICGTVQHGDPKIPDGDPELDALIPGFPTQDAVSIEFDFECPGKSEFFLRYLFGSCEYNEHVDTEFNDVFGFFLNGQNIAVLPGTEDVPVSIHNVNCGDSNCDPTLPGCSPFRDEFPYGGPNCPLLRNNEHVSPGACCPPPMHLDTNLDAFTVVLTATGQLQPGINHIKLAIADAVDDLVDSVVILESVSFTCGAPRGACCVRDDLACSNDVLESECPGQWFVGLTCDQLSPPCDVPLMLALLDRSGSMMEPRATGNTRCADALSRAREDVETFFANHPFGLAAVWTFADYEPTNLTNGFVDQASALAALDSMSPNGCAGFTPLLEAICAAIDALSGAVPNPSPDQLFLAISSDGGENTSDGPCFGPPSFSGDGCSTFDPGSWHRILCDRSEGALVAFVRFWDTFALDRSASLAKETGSPEQSHGISDFMFFSSLAAATDGRLTRHTDDLDDAARTC